MFSERYNQYSLKVRSKYTVRFATECVNSGCYTPANLRLLAWELNHSILAVQVNSFETMLAGWLANVVSPSVTLKGDLRSQHVFAKMCHYPGSALNSRLTHSFSGGSGAEFQPNKGARLETCLDRKYIAICTEL